MCMCVVCVCACVRLCVHDVPTVLMSVCGYVYDLVHPCREARAHRSAYIPKLEQN